jgi:ubiquinone/menaquinone biosynthesis C-methylase UbiE
MAREPNVAERVLMRAFGRPQGVLGRLGGFLMARTNRNMAQRAIELVGVQPSDRVLEIGFGPGVGVELIAEATSTGRVAGVDFSDLMVKRATARNATAIASGRVDLRLGSVERLPFMSSEFDKVMAINSMQLWPDALVGLRECRRVSRPGGRIVLGFTLHSRRGKGGVTELLTQAGFADPRLVDVDDGFCVLATNRH